ncbi:PIG-L deacetylase family protein [Occultella kanbiaonis]|uniref:PIG-L deacetylase family protein n=1 Tax=Occultella kanbiaonis TaxID=2675754 RepID=UPI0013D752DE|nr:PIG-L deacetylase family protein [Occultella kanbiaonis]
MSLSLLGVHALCHTLAAVAALGLGSVLARRFRRHRLLIVVAVVSAIVLVPANLYCAVSPAAHDWLVIGVTLASMLSLATVTVLALTHRVATPGALLPRRVLAIGAHPDDLELACGGTLARLVDSGHEVHQLVMSAGSVGGDGDRRPEEAVRAGGFLGSTRTEVHDFTDTRLEESDVEMMQVIEAKIRRFNPDVIFTHSANDQHQDHRAVHIATLRAARRHPAILCYESPSATRAFDPSVFVDIEGYVDVKAGAVATHGNQRGKPYMSAERVHGKAVHRGDQAKVRHAEGFEPVRLMGFVAGDL